MFEKTKGYIHRNKILDKIAFYLFGLWWVIRAKVVFSKVRKNTLKTLNFDGKAKKILILAVRTIPSTNLVYFDGIFGHAFRKLGASVKMLYCDGFLSSCDADTAYRNQKAQCFVCQKFGPLVKKYLGLDNISYGDYISASDIREIKEKVAGLSNQELLNYNYLGINAGIHARASANRYFLFGKVDLNKPKEVSVLRTKLVYAMIATKIASNVFEEEKPDTILMLHGIYSTWGPFLSYFRLKGAETYVYDNKLSRFGNFTFFHNCEAFKTFGQSWLDFKEQPLAKEEESQLDDYLNERFKGEVGEHIMFKENIENLKKKDSILKSLFENNYARRYILYPNVGWDGSIKGDSSDIFEDMFAWIDAVVEFFKKNRNYQLVIKSHPAELIFTSQGGNKSIIDYVIDNHGPLPENISILKSEVPVKAYDLVSSGTISLTYDGTVGLEAGVLGFPALIAAQTHYTEAGAGFKVKSLDEYLELLENPSPLFDFAKNNIELAKKYAYFYFFKSMVRIPFYRDDRWSIIDWSKVINTKRLFSENSNLIKICKKIMNKQDVINPL